MRGWIGVDFDGTMATYDTWKGPAHVGEPVPAMLFRVRKWLADGREVRIFTARIWPILVVEPAEDVALAVHHPAGTIERRLEAQQAASAVRLWCAEHLGRVLTLTCVKDMAMVELWDDRCVQVTPNTGEAIGHSTRGLS